MNRKLLTFALLPLLFASCSKEASTEEALQSKTISFQVNGDFGNPVFTRATLSADGKAMTDLWLFDYQDGQLVQTIHQTSDQSDFGTPSLPVAFGQHTIYFVCSRGDLPTVSESNHSVSWQKPRDTFWQKYVLTISSGTAASHSVTLDRVCTRLKVKILDVVPDELATVTITPDTWYYGIDYMTGNATDARSEEPREVDIPASYAGTQGELGVDIFGLSNTTEWQTNFSVTARDAEDEIIGQATVANAPFKANRATIYSGSLFSAGSTFTLSLNDQWDDPYNGEW